MIESFIGYVTFLAIVIVGGIVWVIFGTAYDKSKKVLEETSVGKNIKTSYKNNKLKRAEKLLKRKDF